MLGIGQENHNRLSEELNRLIIDCTIGFLFAVSNNIQRSLKEYQKPEHVCSWLKTDCQKCKVMISCQRCEVIQFTVKITSKCKGLPEIRVFILFTAISYFKQRCLLELVIVRVAQCSYINRVGGV